MFWRLDRAEASMHTLIIWLRFVHIVAGTFWVGGAFLIAGFIAPAVRAVGPAAAPVMRHLTAVQKLPYWLVVAGLASLISGAYLTWIISAGSITSWVRTGAGATYAIGAVAAFAAAIIGTGINIPTANRLGRLAARGAAEHPDLSYVLARRLAIGTCVVALLLFIAASAMAVARYMR
jgi:uncharacterized membrane protein